MSIHYENKSPCCPRCLHRGFDAQPYDPEKTKIVFECGRCGNEWSAGTRGGEFTSRCQDPEYARKIADRYWKERVECAAEDLAKDKRYENNIS